MPNPYVNNDKAARFVDYYASPNMLKKSVDRLYYGGVAWKKATQERMERLIYPPEPVVHRTQSEINAYLEERVQHELLRRQQRQLELRRQLYPEPGTNRPVLNEKELRRHIKHVYTDPIRRRRLRQREIERIFGIPPASGSAAPNNPVAKGMKAREEKWRPPSASPPHKEDYRLLLVSQYDYYADPKKTSELQLRRRPLKTTEDRESHLRRLTELSKPQSITPRRDLLRHAESSSGFRVHRKIDYNR